MKNFLLYLLPCIAAGFIAGSMATYLALDKQAQERDIAYVETLSVMQDYYTETARLELTRQIGCLLLIIKEHCEQDSIYMPFNEIMADYVKRDCTFDEVE